MAKFVIVTEKVKQVKPHPDCLVVTPQDFIRDPSAGKTKKTRPKVINLCGNYSYLSKGYYVSLLAEARGFHCVPGVRNIISLNWKRNYEFALPELNTLLRKSYDEPSEDPICRTYTTCFGRHENPKLEPVTRRLFDLFRFPLIAFDVKYTNEGVWSVDKIDMPSFSSLPEDRLARFQDALDRFTGSAWRTPSKTRKQEKYWLAILQDPKEEFPPSDKVALKNFVRIGKQMGIWVELLTKQDFASLLEYDALFIRETTAIDNHTYRFASKAESEGIPAIDDTLSIVRCCNKVYLNELMHAHHIPVPKTFILDRKTGVSIQDQISFPAVLKIPDGSFSRGVVKAETPEDFDKKAKEMLKKSDIILCQEFVRSEFDWRIGILNDTPLFAAQYYMARGHWQIYNHGAKSKKLVAGGYKCFPLDEVPAEVLSTALKAARKIGTGLYGVDLKQTKEGRVVVIEVNDNPNIDSDVEDLILGDKLYARILEHFVTLMES